MPTELPEISIHRMDALEAGALLAPGSVQLLYVDPPFFSGRVRKHPGGSYAYDDRWPGGMAEYLGFLRVLLEAAHPLLRERGLMVLHLDWRAVHYARVEMDRVFGPERFVNEIIWSYRTGGQSPRFLPRKHDNLLVYARGENFTFHPQQEKSRLAHRYGFGNVEIHEDESGYYRLAAMRDVWEIPALRGNHPEYLGYPTQKPLELLRRLIVCFSDPGDLVADLCCGSGTTLAAAAEAGRRAFGCDRSPDAVTLAESRLGLSGTKGGRKQTESTENSAGC